MDSVLAYAVVWLCCFYFAYCIVNYREPYDGEEDATNADE